MEAVDHSRWDKYDLDESDDLGIVSGTELGHNWGTDHDYGTNSNGQWNIMAGGKDQDKRGFWFTSEGKTEVKGATAGNM